MPGDGLVVEIRRVTAEFGGQFSPQTVLNVVYFETRFPEGSRIHSCKFCAQLLHLVEHVGERSLQAQRLLDLIRRHVWVLAVLQEAGEVVLAHELHE